MKTNPILVKALGLCLVMTAPASLLANVDIDVYGSARMQAEAVIPNDGVNFQSGEDKNYIGLRDAYSRFGIKANWQAKDTVEVFGQLEIPFDTANFEIQDPYDDRRNLRIALVGLNTDHGTVAYGQMWLPFYNAISYKVDRFSSYYSGYATLAQFRAYNAISYYSPNYNGLSFAGGIVLSHDSDQADSFDDNRYQLTATYNKDGTDLSVGLEQVDNASNEQLVGVALGQQIDQLYLAIKIEQWNADGASQRDVINLYADYQVDKYTFKAMIADVDGFGGEILHIGTDYQYSKNLKTFVEFYLQEESNAIANKKAGGAGSFADPLVGGGYALTMGFRYDF